MPSTAPATGLTYDDLAAFPEDHIRREIIGGELFVSPSPTTRHQRVIVFLTVEFHHYAQTHGGAVYPGPTDLYLSHSDVVVPDVLFVRADHLAQVEEPFVRGAVDLVVEVSSPSNRRHDLVRKRALYERYGVREYWFVDLQAGEAGASAPVEGGDQVECVYVFRLVDGCYGEPLILKDGETLAPPGLPGFQVAVSAVLGA